MTQVQYARITGESLPAKYRNVKQKTADGTFDSRREFDRWAQLKILERAGQIQDLRRQVRYPLVVNGVKVCVYVADFVYVQGGVTVVEDAKGVKTPAYNIKKKLMHAVHGIAIKEV